MITIYRLESVWNLYGITVPRAIPCPCLRCRAHPQRFGPKGLVQTGLIEAEDADALQAGHGKGRRGDRETGLE